MIKGQKIRNIFGLDLFLIDTRHIYKPVTKKCMVCKNYKKILDSPEWNGSLLTHLAVEHNVKQREPLGNPSWSTNLHVTCPDCGRPLEDHCYSASLIDFRCRKCGYNWILERRYTFDPKALAREEAKYKPRRSMERRRRF